MATSQSCKSCTLPDNDEMVQCDACDDWHHFTCVGTDDTVAGIDWQCDKCVNQKTKPRSDPPKSHSRRSNASSKRVAQLALELQILEEETLLADKHAREADERAVKRAQQEREFLTRKRDLLQRQAEQTEDESSEASTKSRSVRIAKWIRDSAKNVAEPAVNNSPSGLSAPFAGLKIIPYVSPTTSTPHGNPIVNSGLANVNITKPESGAVPRRTVPPVRSNGAVSATTLTGIPPAHATVPTLNRRQQQSVRNDIRPDADQHEMAAVAAQPVNRFHPQSASNDIQPEADRYEITHNQYAARQAVSKDLPIFTGRPEEWPVFISSFENSTRTCGFTNAENLMRLQRCLRGRALEEISYGLLFPASVPDVIETLRELYGRPEVIVNDLLQRIRSLPSPKYEKLETLIKFSFAVQNFVRVLQATQLVDHIRNPMLVQELLEKLPPQLRIDWALQRSRLNGSDIAAFSTWLAHIARAANSVTLPVHDVRNVDTSQERRSNSKFKARVLSHDANDDSDETADRTGEGVPVNAHGTQDIINNRQSDHQLQMSAPPDEAQLRSMSLPDRRAAIRIHKLCRRCFKSYPHDVPCSGPQRCGVDGCVYRHHPILHDDKYHQTEVARTETICSTHQQPSLNGGVYFRIVPVKLFGKTKSIETFAFLDEGSSITMIEDSTAAALELEGVEEKLCLKWTGDTIREEADSKRVDVKVSGQQDGGRIFQLRNVRTVKSLNLPVQSVCKEELVAKYAHLVDVPFVGMDRATPRILIGIDHWKLGMPSKVIEAGWDKPAATETRLGWIIHGQHDRLSTVHHSFHICRCSNDDAMHTLIKSFFSTENFGVKIPTKLLESDDDKRARYILESSTKRIDNRYVTGLLWSRDSIKLPDSFPMAKRRLICLERKLATNILMAANLKDQLKAYETKGYSRKLSVDEINAYHPQTWYLPIFCVTNHNKPGKVRMVWDAAATVGTISLNSVLLKGPCDLPPLPKILYGFRQRAVAIAGDIREMFHQVRIQESDQQSQRFLWRNDDGQIDVYVLQVMTFGATCSPSSAQYVKNLNAKRFQRTHPRAVKSIVDHHYVDDMLDSVDTIEEAINLVKEVRTIHRQGGFEIRNWVSSHADVLRAIDAVDGENSNKSMGSKAEIDAEKILGMWWRPKVDAFTYLVKLDRIDRAILNGERVPTKREVLRTLMSVFDPLGFLASYLIYLKILLQDIWRSEVSWDEKICDEHSRRWQIWTELLPEVRNVSVPRCYSLLNSTNRTTELHIFVDASVDAFAAVAYFRYQSHTSTECALIGAKTKVAPRENMSIPRMELQAALLGARFMSSICQNHENKIDQRLLWSDSRTVLSWLKADPRAMKQFVSFRIAEIRELTELNEWRWIPTQQNVADEATKWQRRPNLTPGSRWFRGPQFLFLDKEHWPVDERSTDPIEESMLEMKRVMYHQAFIELQTVNVKYFSSWYRMLRAQARFLQCVKKFCGKGKSLLNLTENLCESELQSAEIDLFRRAQYDGYAEEFIALTNGAEVVGLRSNLRKLSPYVDERGVLRVRGRIDAANVAFSVKRPIILPRHHDVTMRILEDYHARFHHINHETVLNEVRQRFMVPRLRQTMKKIRSVCRHCRIQNAKPVVPVMAPLPIERLASFTRPFTFTGIDCFGPLTIAVGRRTEKRWGVLFTCLTIRAVHVELATSLSTSSCILCLRNFIARRGRPKSILSDNGTNFHGADNEMRKSLEQARQDRICEGIQWRFNPPSAPHMGGAWERLIGSIKKVILQIVPTQRYLSEEVLRAVLIEAEGIVNSRPLTFVSLEHEDQEALTPNHFLIGSSNGFKPPGVFDNKDLNLRNDWKAAQALADEFWRRWVAEYLPMLTRRTRWFTEVKNIEVGDVVVIVDGNLPRNDWRKGRVIATNVGKDGRTRSATVQTRYGTLNRPVVKLAVIDTRDNAEVGRPN